MSLDYAINKYPQDTELKEIAKQWNKNNVKFVWDLNVSIVFMFYHYSYFLSICRTGSFVVEWLIEKLNNDDKHYDALQLNLDRYRNLLSLHLFYEQSLLYFISVYFL